MTTMPPITKREVYVINFKDLFKTSLDKNKVKNHLFEGLFVDMHDVYDDGYETIFKYIDIKELYQMCTESLDNTYDDHPYYRKIDHLPALNMMIENIKIIIENINDPVIVDLHDNTK